MPVGISTKWRRIATPVYGLVRNDRLFCVFFVFWRILSPGGDKNERKREKACYTLGNERSKATGDSIRSYGKPGAALTKTASF